MSTRLVLNPVSGTDEGLPQLLHLNERLRARFGHLDIVLTTGPGDAERAGLRAARDGGLVVVAGGDGTLNEVVNGVHRGSGFDRVRFGVLPLGTGNDFATALGIPADLDEAIDVLGAGCELAVDVGTVNDRAFVNVSAGGFVAEVSDAVTPGLKSVAGRLAYLLGGAQVLLSWEPVVAEFSSMSPAQALTTGGAFGPEALVTATRREIQFYAVCNSRLIGGGQPIAPLALVDDGCLDVCVVESMAEGEFLALLGRVSSGGHLEHPRVSYLRVRDLDVRFDRTLKVNTDGQVFDTDHCAYRILPRAARILVPPPGANGDARP